jgi:thiamine-phosphate pyrophosphorylase
MITDRQRLGAGWEDALVERVSAAARAGVHLIQIRERDLEARPLTRLVERTVRAVRGTRARVIVNDRLDVALAAGAHGVHLPGNGVEAARVRRQVPRGFLVGRSIHTVDEAAEGRVDYLIFGTVFETASKPGVSAAGVEALRAVAAATTTPVLAVGGMAPARLGSVAGVGAAGFAGIRMFVDPSPEALQVIVRQASLAFDTPRTVP